MVNKIMQRFHKLPLAQLQLSFSERLLLIVAGLLLATLAALSGIAPLQAAPPPGSVDPTFQSGRGLGGVVVVTAIQADGKIVIGGNFATYNTINRNNIARLNSDSTFDTSFNPGSGANNTIYAMAIQADGKIVIGGNFTTYNGITRTSIARVNSDGSLDTSFNPGTGANGGLSAIAIQADGKIIIGGTFTQVGGQARGNLARLNSDGSLDTSFNIGTGANNLVNTISIQADGKIIIGGFFNLFNGTTRNNIARLNSDGTLDTSFSPGSGANSQLQATAIQPDGKIIIAGSFTSYNGTGRNYIARLNSDGSLDASFNPGSGTDWQVNTVAIQPDGKIIIGGYISSYNGIGINAVVRINSDGSLATPFNSGSGANSYVLATAIQADGKIIIAGSFTSYNGTNRNRIARLNSDGSLDTSFNPGTGVNGQVNAMALQADGKIIIVGGFTSYNGTNRNYIVRINSDGTLDTSFNSGSGANQGLNSIAIQADGKIIVSGGFTSYSGANLRYIARLNSDGTIDTNFNPGAGPNNVVNAMALQADGKIIIVGGFTSYNGTNRNYIARLNGDGSLDTSFNPGTGADSAIAVISLQADGKIIIAGSFTSYNGTNRNYIARLNSDGSLNTSFNTSLGVSIIRAISLQADGKIIIGGYISSNNGTNRNYVARLNSDGSLDTSFNTSLELLSTVYTMAIQADGKIIIGGFFYSVNNYTRDFIARLENSPVPTLTLVSSVNPSQLGQSVTFTANASPITATGTVTFTDGATLLGTANLTSGVATYVISTLTGGTHLITAQYGGDTTFAPATSNVVTQVVQVSNISFSSPAYTVSETGGTAIFTVTRSGSLFGPATAQMQVLNQTTDTRDYQIPLPGSLDTTFGDANVVGQRVRRMIAQPDGKIIIGGTFSQVGGQNRSNLARLNSDGSLDSSFSANAGVNGTIYEMALQPDGKIVVAGTFTLANGQTRNNIARLNSDGTLDTAFNPDLNSLVLGLRLQLDGKLLVGGEFTQAGGQSRTRLVRLNADGSVDSTFSAVASADAVVRTFVPQADGKIYVGGQFTQLNGAARAKFARLNSDGTLDSSFTDLALNGDVYRAILLPSGKVLVGGTFTQVGAGGQTRNRLVQLNADGSVDTTFVAGTNDYVAELEYTPSGKLVILGNFSQVNGVAQGGVAQLYADGMLDTSYTDLGLGGQAFALGVQGNDAILIGGEFTQVAGFTRRLVARVYGNFGEVRWQDGEGGDRIIQMPIVNDGIAEGNETFVLTVTNPVNLVPIVPSSALVTIIDSSTVLTVTQPTDDGSGQVANSLSWALLQPLVAGQGTVVRFNVPGGVITVNGTLPVVKSGVFVDGGATGITIDGNGVAGDGLRLSGNNTLSSLTIRRFGGRELLLLGTGNKLFRVRIES